ncbi:MAG: hypothetical protein ABIV28_05910 [Longimicrobiales bacterium]
MNTVASKFIAVATTIIVAGCAVDTGEDTQTTTEILTTAPADSPGQAAGVPITVVPDSFSKVGAFRVYDARKAVDLTGDGQPETVVVHAAGPRTDSARIDLVILGGNADTLFHHRFSTQLYFIYEYRSTMSDSAADAKIIANLRHLLSDSAFSTGGPPARMQKALPGGIDRDAIRYDLKEAAVRGKYGLNAAQQLTGPMFAEMEKVPVSNASIDSLATELKAMPTFTYYAGGEATYTVAWSQVKRRFVRIFSCC